MLSRLRFTSFIEKLQRRSSRIVFFVLALLALSVLSEQLVLHYLDARWPSFVESYTHAQLQEVNTAFDGVQRRVRQIATELARHPAITSYLLGTSNDVAEVFRQAARISRSQDVSAEVYDSEGMLVAWHGRSGQVDQREVQLALRGILTSYVTRGPIYSQLFVISPVRAEGEIRGAVIIREAVEVNYPISNRFIEPAGLAEQLSNDLGVMVEIEYGESAMPRNDGRFSSIELRGIDGKKLGVASILRYSKSAYLEEASSTFRKLHSMFLLALLAVLLFMSSRWFGKMRGALLKGIVVTGIIWGIRYLLLWLDIPGVWVGEGIFDPRYFASKFGGGLAKSIGEMFLTSVALFINTLVVLKLTRVEEFSWFEGRRLLPLRILLATGCTALMYLMLRGYAAVIRSAVFDSSLRFNDPKVIVPSPELAIMVFNLFLISFCLIVVSVGLTLIIIRLFREESAASIGNRPLVIIVGTLFLVASVVFGIVQETPLMSTPFRLAFGMVLMAITFRVLRQLRRKRTPVSFINALIILGFSAGMFYTLLDDSIHQQDRSRIEVFAREVLRPVDNWLRFVVDESLHGFVTDESFDVLMHGDREELERLAFTTWARSAAARQGYNCLFVVFGPDSTELSRFVIGEHNPMMYETARQALSRIAKKVGIQEVGTGMNSMKIYSGAIPIIAADRIQGYGVVVVSVTQQSLFRGETPGVFRSVSQENLEAFYRQITLNEFRNGILVSSSDPSWPVQHRLPEEIRESFRDSTRVSVWGTDRAAGREYETLYIKRLQRPDEVVSLSLERTDILWHLFGIVRTLVYFAFVLIAGVVGIVVYRWLEGESYRPAFRDKLLLALLVTAAVPVIVIAGYARVFATDRVSSNLSNQLGREIDIIESELMRGGAIDTTGKKNTPSVETIERIASELKVDFNYYTDNSIVVTSRPELYDTGILDRRMSGEAFNKIVINGRRFHMETENIGSYQYAVGYRPVISPDGEVNTVIAVPTLYRQEEIEEEVAQINAVLFGVSAVIFFLMAVVATTLANRIASPILKLTEATKRVALGDLDVRVETRAEGEIGDLIKSFEAMTAELKRGRENLVQYEREMAWKEMAKQVAHEIKNPLTPIKLALQHLQQTYKDRAENFDEVFEEVSKMVIRQVDALSRIASEFSAFARMPTARLEKISINDVLREAVYLFEQDTRVHFEATYGKQLPPIMADREELRRAFINIIRNGIQAMDNEGRIETSTARVGDNIEIRIRDYGCGIPESIKEKLFQPNFSTKTEGMGLGLAIVKKTIDDLNGLISVESVLNEGSTFILSIPLPGSPHANPHD